MMKFTTNFIGSGVGPAKHSSNKNHGKSAEKQGKKTKKMVKKALTIAIAILSVFKSIATAIGPEAETYGYAIDIVQGIIAIVMVLF